MGVNDSAVAAADPPFAGWPLAGGLTAVALAALLGIYHSTFLSMVEIWQRSDTFAHGFLVFPVTGWLVWRRRQRLAQLTPRPDYLALPVLAVLGLGWLVARLTGALVVEQLALIGLIAVTVWLMLGRRVVGELLFPLGFLVFAVPMGESLIPPLMAFTADFTTGMLRLVGIPVYREGTFFSIPSGDWSVVEACSGLRYLIASVTLGFLYAYLSYRSLLRRLAFLALAMVFPVIANGLRAFLIVMLAHLSDMKLAVGVDHLIYGWVFFGAVMLFLFWLGALWTEREPDRPTATPADPGPGKPADAKAFAFGLLATLAIAAVWPVRAAYLEQWSEARSGPVELVLPEGAGPWRAVATVFTDWEPSYKGADLETSRVYQDGRDTVELHVLYYRRQRQGEELINSRNVLIRQKHPVWKMPEEQPRRVQLNGRPVMVLQGRLNSPSQRLLTWRWYRIGGHYLVDEYAGKLLEARDRLLGRSSDEAAIVLATEAGDNPEAAAKVLQRFADAMLPSLELSLNRAAEP
ncbi:exosortase A [Candidatus Methylocalor cossyra]|uniref:EpsH n=1 Tax=Candidatus Methylocalor cossyra TaxID=3108543 RepID=A0ABM9NFZ4_9GAMM